ncbi:MAG TPA: potassium/proton antiporter [Solirubrobacteraceae bacterium]|nr:potassium/proton antiporter [Solirubrobacteraceae bacterium]
MTDGQLILVAGALIAAGLVASLGAGRVRVPSLVALLCLGMLVGSGGLGWLPFDDYELARTVGVIALSLILFEGGLTAGLQEIRPVLAPAGTLATVGTAVTAAVTGLVATWLLDLSLLEGLLLGAILSSTDGAAIFGLLRGSTLRRRLARTLEGEAGFNDPVAVLLVLGFSAWITEPGYGIADFAWLMVRQGVIGLAVGVAVGWLAVAALRRVRLATPGLYPVASLATAAIAYGAADSIHGSGFLAVYIAGLALGTATIPAKQTVTTFHQGLAWVAQLALFVTLGLLVFADELPAVAWEGTLLALVVVFAARPLAVLVSTAPFRYSPGDQVVLSWAGLRGAVPVVLATFPVLAGVPDSEGFFDIVFFAVLLSTLLQGSTFEPLARRLGRTTAEPALPRPLAEAGTIRRLGAEVLEYPVGPEDAVVGARVRDLGLPRDAVVNVIVRGDEAIPPRGSTRLRAGDRLHVLLRAHAARDMHRLLDRWRDGPVGPPPRPRRPEASGRSPVLVSWRWGDADGDPAHPATVRGHDVVHQLRVRRDVPGGLWMLADGRYAVTGPVAAVGGRRDLGEWARRRIARASPDERAWLQTVVGALAAELGE